MDEKTESIQSKKTSPYISIETIPLTDKQTKDIKKLGLTPKPQVKIVTNEKGERIIHGRFLHITDIHPDPYYKAGSSLDEACHAGKGTAGKYGDAILGCDAPMILMDDTIAWIKENLKDKIDFVVWTGDNVRHDNDRQYPRTESQIFDMNQHVSDLMYEVFKKNDSTPGLDVDLVPSLGNNDVYPHNLFSPGPTLQTRELYRIWQKFIPPEQLHTFNRGAYFFQEVIPNKLAVLSINTLYLFQSNPLVDNCDKKKEPGYKLFEWLGYTLKEMRARNMKVWLSGHVPPNEKNFDISCLRKYIVWMHEYRDIIIGGLYGHMNLDHFIPLDSVAAYKSIDNANKDKKKKKKKGKKSKSKGKGKKKSKKNSIDEFEAEFFDDSVYDSDYDSDFDDDYTAPLEETNFYRVFDENFDKDFFRVQGGVPNGKVKYMETLRETLYADIKGKRKSGYLSERYSIAHVTASVIPTFNPGLRVWEYNITNLAEDLAGVKFAPWNEFFTGLDQMLESFDKYDTEPEAEEDDSFFSIFGKKNRDKTFPLPMPEDKELGPGYVKQTFTPERYVQYYADLENINSGKKDFGYEIEYSTTDDLYKMDSLVVDEWIKYGRKLGKPIKDQNNEAEAAGKKRKSKKKKNGKEKVDYEKLGKIWNEYLKNTFVSSDYENRGYG
ncbi:phosphate metabolism transcription is regulated by PHO system [Spathaspora passalidarum NRRL Y-27907]|uniref:Endopolyphosphatase n=1 Tax=Spathaspora passalidarum (strain NRRL Y-27907 / 11-Y1) TaxID=619300 RepID=G3AVC3_SPAPN|nr:phosphate metabolism transcription is regulated by PHO system [Spathaspora passalidarum NRRL Y-27907]EGW30142.1 phosphate metabolism transcription is regulated by PHO system [Spathaspora passalidarum NRRL Y-27907]